MIAMEVVEAMSYLHALSCRVDKLHLYCSKNTQRSVQLFFVYKFGHINIHRITAICQSSLSSSF